MWFRLFALQQNCNSDYPVWADNTVIPMMGEFITWMVCAAASLPLALALMFRHQFVPSLRPRRPTGWLGWARAVILWLWIALNVLLVGVSIWDGDEGMVISCVGAMPLLLALLSAQHACRDVAESGINTVVTSPS